jgi:DNA-binding transcriptional MerR regulator
MALSTPPEGSRDYRVDELAREAGTTVRNVRAYQDRGLLPAPRREGRVGLYTDAHLARLRLIGDLLERGYTTANIAELLAAWERGQDLGALLGLEAVLGGPWAERPSLEVSAAQLAEMFGSDAGTFLSDAIDAGLLVPAEPGSYRVANPAALEVGRLLRAAGVPLAAAVDAARRMHDDVGDIARTFVDLVETHVFDPLGEPIPSGAVAGLAALLGRLRPLASKVVEWELASAMEEEIRRRFGEHLERFGKPASRTVPSPPAGTVTPREPRPGARGSGARPARRTRRGR